MLNTVILKGNLTRDPEMRYTPKGTAVVKISLAVNEVWYNEAQEKQERVHFIDCDAFGRVAENVAQYFYKGKPIVVAGRLHMDTWDDKQTGQKKSKLKVVFQSFEFCGDTKAGDQRQPGAEGAQPDAAAGSEVQPDAGDDVPF